MSLYGLYSKNTSHFCKWTIWLLHLLLFLNELIGLIGRICNRINFAIIAYKIYLSIYYYIEIIHSQTNFCGISFVYLMLWRHFARSFPSSSLLCQGYQKLRKAPFFLRPLLKTTSKVLWILWYKNNELNFFVIINLVNKMPQRYLGVCFLSTSQTTRGIKISAILNDGDSLSIHANNHFEFFSSFPWQRFHVCKMTK